MKRQAMNVRSVLALLFLSGVALALVGGLRSVRAAGPNNASASIQETMLTVVDPSADAIWASVGTEETKTGTKLKAPHTTAQWQKVVEYSQSLIVGAKQLQTPGFPVGANAHSKLADSDTPGTRTAAQIRSDIDANPARFIAAAKQLESASNHALSAAKSHDTNGILTAGAELDAACEACHASYWYPRAAPLHLPSPEDFATKTPRP